MRFAVLCLLCFCSLPGTGQVQFVEGSFESLLAKADSGGKYLMVDAYTDWCGWCKVMDKETFDDSLTGVYINERFVSTKLNMEEGFGVDMAMKHRVGQFPQYLFFDAEGQLIGRISGFLKPNPFMEKVQAVVYEEAHLPKGSAPMDFAMDYPDWYRLSLLKNKERKYPSLEQMNDWLASRNSLLDEASWGVMHRFVQGGPYAAKIAENRDALVARYGKREVNDKIAALIFNDVKTAIKDRDEDVLQNALDACGRYLGDEAADYTFRYRLYYHQMTEQWQGYTDLVNSERASGRLSDESLLYSSQSIMNRCNEPAAVQEAIRWVDGLLNSAPTVKTLLTRAGLALKAEDETVAKQWAEKAKVLAEERNEDLADVEQFMQQFH